MAKTPSQVGLLAAANPVYAGSPNFAGQDPWNNQGTPGGPVMNANWAHFFDMLKAAAPGGISYGRKTAPPEND